MLRKYDLVAIGLTEIKIYDMPDELGNRLPIANQMHTHHATEITGISSKVLQRPCTAARSLGVINAVDKILSLQEQGYRTIKKG